jgi:hypothetical protein
MRDGRGPRLGDPNHPNQAPTLIIDGDQPPSERAGPPLDRWIKFGDWLLRRGLISRADLYQALQRAAALRIRIGDALVAEQMMPRTQVEHEASAFAAFQEQLRESAGARGDGASAR